MSHLQSRVRAETLASESPKLRWERIPRWRNRAAIASCPEEHARERIYFNMLNNEERSTMQFTQLKVQKSKIIILLLESIESQDGGISPSTPGAIQKACVDSALSRTEYSLETANSALRLSACLRCFEILLCRSLSSSSTWFLAGISFLARSWLWRIIQPPSPVNQLLSIEKFEFLHHQVVTNQTVCGIEKGIIL